MNPILSRLKDAASQVADNTMAKKRAVQQNVAAAIARAPVARAVASTFHQNSFEYTPLGIVDAIQQRPGVQKLKAILPFGKVEAAYEYVLPTQGRSESNAEELQAI